MAKDIPKKLQELKARHERVVRKRDEAAAEAKVRRAELDKLLHEIREAGYDPSTLRDELQKAEAELQEAMDRFEEELSEAERAFSL